MWWIWGLGLEKAVGSHCSHPYKASASRRAKGMASLAEEGGPT